MSEDAVLGPDELLPGRSFTDPVNSERDRGIMQELLERQRELVSSELAGDLAGQQVLRRTDDAGNRLLLVVPSVRALVETNDPTAIGFFGTPRESVDHAVLFGLEEQLVARMEEHGRTGLLSYFDVELGEGRYGNLIFFSTPEVPAAWHADEIHRRAVELSSGHYECIRLHKGRLPGGLLGGAEIVLERTRYFDFTTTAPWQGTRVLTTA